MTIKHGTNIFQRGSDQIVSVFGPPQGPERPQPEVQPRHQAAVHRKLPALPRDGGKPAAHPVRGPPRQGAAEPERQEAERPVRFCVSLFVFKKSTSCF